MTNFEKIKAMNSEKLAKYIAKYADIDSDFCKYCPAFEMCNGGSFLGCYEPIEKWLESEVES